MESSRQLAKTWPYPRHGTYVRHMRKAAKAWFVSKGFAVNPKHEYCLAEWEDWPRNIILPEVVEYIRECRREQADGRPRLQLHKYVHHGLSSQALLFNLVGPLIVRQDLEPLERALGDQEIACPSGKLVAVFEYEDRDVFNEDSGQATSIDLVVTGDRGQASLFIECKLVEAEFGGCSVFQRGDCDGANPADHPENCYLHHIGRSYWSLLKEHGFLTGGLAAGPTCVLASHYQFFREVLFAIKEHGLFILLSDQRSPVFFCESENGREPRGRMGLLSSLVPDCLRKNVHHASIQGLVHAIKESGRHPWIDEFEDKYGFRA